MEDTGFTEIFIKKTKYNDGPLLLRLDGRWLAMPRGYKIIVRNSFLPIIDEEEIVVYHSLTESERKKLYPYEKVRPASKDEYERQF